MPRKKQLVQRKRRTKVYREGESAAPLDLRPKGFFRVFHNYKLFAVIGAVVMIGSIGFTALLRNNTPTSSSPRGQPVIRTTPEAGATSTTGAASEIKQYAAPPPMSIDLNKTYTAVIKTDKGDVKVELFPKQAPELVNNFVFLAQQGFYNGNTFYRVIADKQGTVHFVQAGDPTGLGTGGPGYTLPSEPTPTLASSFDSAGVLAAARPPGAGQPNNGSQFFITTTPEPTFDGQYTVFGKVLSGLDVLSKLPPRDPLAQQNPPAGTRITGISILSS